MDSSEQALQTNGNLLGIIFRINHNFKKLIIVALG